MVGMEDWCQWEGLEAELASPCEPCEVSLERFARKCVEASMDTARWGRERHLVERHLKLVTWLRDTWLWSPQVCICGHLAHLTYAIALYTHSPANHASVLSLLAFRGIQRCACFLQANQDLCEGWD